jgi:hypothetical protein
VHERGRLEGVIRPLAAQVSGRERAQLVVDGGQRFIHRVRASTRREQVFDELLEVRTSAIHRR